MKFISQLQNQGKIQKKINPTEIALDMLSIYQGIITFWRLTNNPKHISILWNASSNNYQRMWKFNKFPSIF
ncbi:MAG: hypothetical protein N3A69_04465 [Leptospiraceae bacterium]|nr:hypothetical protein [Leptospiraceae bacterium]